MPRQIDHDARRRQVTAAASDLVVREGRAALTVRNVADAVGCSTTVVSHYFTDMAELLHATYTTAAERARARTDAVMERDPLDLVGVIEAVLPLDADRRGDWTIWFAFWTEALTDERLRAEQRRNARATTDRLARILRAWLAEQPHHRPAPDVDGAADRLAALIQGIAAQAAFDPRRWTPARQRRVVADELAAIGIARHSRAGRRHA